MTKPTSLLTVACVACFALLLANPSTAAIVGVAGSSSLETALETPTNVLPEIITPPDWVLDDNVVNRGMKGFNEAQGVVTSQDYAVDNGVIAQGTLVDSHMIFLNSTGYTLLQHVSVEWTFDGVILGVMSDFWGNLEAASTAELGSPTTIYNVPASDPDRGAPYRARGMESGGRYPDSYTIIDDHTISVTMRVTEPGDWIRVVTAPPSFHAPEPTSFLTFGGLLALGACGFYSRRRDRSRS
jgi:hypothetical protein